MTNSSASVLVSIAIAGISMNASADFTFHLNGDFLSNTSDKEIAKYGELYGTLTGARINATYLQGNLVQANSITVWMSSNLILIGGNISQIPSHPSTAYYGWTDGATTQQGTQFNSEVIFDQGYSSPSGVNLFVTNPFSDQVAWGRWDGTITLIGLSVPTPGAISLISLALLKVRRRRN